MNMVETHSEIDRLGHVLIAACVQRFLARFWRIVRGNRDNRYFSEAFVLSNLSRRGQAIEKRGQVLQAWADYCAGPAEASRVRSIGAQHS